MVLLENIFVDEIIAIDTTVSLHQFVTKYDAYNLFDNLLQ